ncbi:MAG: hypothetical protein A2095_04685 [Sphingomonadales bacterium GWF1_63_6]|nr:MAG: hypothetical protein A2095_04685 [Sphingomonadales bacterium GWF1_63_6]
MFVVTFYSYKGGVGRTMALVNVAVAQAKLGKKVLVVDFDLEAPGLQSYKVFQDASCDRGIVDYITAYRLTGAAPIAGDYITHCKVEGTPIWLMPAGRHTKRGYTDMLNAIDWQELYEDQEGYLMFEDLKRQWQSQGFDYVLIDSRTGHTDVGGICTRQLPDAVVIMFLPNPQNIAGLGPIVDSIHAENKLRKKNIALHFCASNVPLLDDENNILADAFASASERLGYEQDSASRIEHYSSLEVLTQSAFVLSRANSRLAKQYEELRQSVVALNFEDREGAVVALCEMPQLFEDARRHHRTKVREVLLEQTREIRTLHPDDGEIAFLSARVLSDVGDPTSEIESLSIAIRNGFEANRARLGRAYNYLVLGRGADASEDLLAVLGSPTATVFELGPALQLLQTINGWTSDLERVLDRPDTEFSTIASLASFIMSIRDALPAMASRLEMSADSKVLSPANRKFAYNHAILCHIGAGAFERAKNLIGLDPRSIAPDTSVQDIFNYAIADWGESGAPNVALFAELVKRMVGPKGLPAEDSNIRQCLALALSVQGDIEGAQQSLREAFSIASVSPGEMVFDCWRYLYIPGEEMLAELRRMEEILAGGHQLQPVFFAEVRAE